PIAGDRTNPYPASRPAASGIAMMLYPAAHQRFWIILRYVARDNAMIRGTSRGSLRRSTMSPASTATSGPAPVATPTSAVTIAGPDAQHDPPPRAARAVARASAPPTAPGRRRRTPGRPRAPWRPSPGSPQNPPRVERRYRVLAHL